MTPLELLFKRNQGMHTDASKSAGRNFTPRPTDVFIATYPKCGTTWVTQIVHQLRTGGDMSFGEISEVCPWEILALDCKQDVNADQAGKFRVFKSHEAYDSIAKGGRYIHVCREPKDAFVSFYRFLLPFVALPEGSIPVEQFAEAIFGGVSHSGGIWDFYVSWWEQRDNPNVLWVCFEDLKADLKGEIARIASFLGFSEDKALFDMVLEKSSFKFMADNSKQFDGHFEFESTRDMMGIPKDYVFGELGGSKVRAGGGTTGEGKVLPENVLEMLRKRWENTVEAKTGLKSYADMRDALRQLRKK
jgi:aryl sulfotransferase